MGMAKIVATASVSLDGVAQGLGRPDEDTRDGFDRGGWGPAYTDAVMMEVMGRGMATTRAMLFGRRTYLDFHRAWAGRTDGNPFTEVLDKTPKYVASRTLGEPLPWQNSILLSGDAQQSVAALKTDLTDDVVILGSGELVRSLAAAGLIDRYVLSIHPLVLGAGRRFFAERGPLGRLRLTDSVSTTTGVLIASYDVQPE
jgi:dihydrofolate reductase